MKFSKLIICSATALALCSCGASRSSSGTQKNASSKNGKSVAAVAQLSDDEQRRYDYYFLEAVKQKGLGNYSEVYDLLEHCLSINPKAASAQSEMAQYYLALGRNTDALVALETAVENAPDNYWYAQTLASLYQEFGEKEKMVSTLENMTEQFPERREVLYMLVDAYGDVGNDAKVVETLDRIEALMGKNEQITMQKVNAHMRLGDKKKAIAEVEELMNEYPQDSHYKLTLGGIYMRTGEEQKAYDIYQSVLAEEPNNVSARLALASYYENSGEQGLFQQQIETLLESKDVSAQIKHAMLMERIGYAERNPQDSVKIVPLLDKAVASENCNADLLLLYSQYLWQKESKQQSKPYLERAVEMEPDNGTVNLMLLQLAVEAEDNAEVEKVCRAGIDAIPEQLTFYLYLALVYNEAERYDDALEVIKRGIGMVGDASSDSMVADLYSLEGDIYHHKNMSDEAYAAYDKSLEYSPQNVGVLNNYAYYLSVDNRDLDKAEEMSYRTIKAEPDNSTYLDTYAWILFMKGRYTEARTYIDQAIKNNKDASGVVTEHCGDIYYMTGDEAQALVFWQKALEEGNDSKTLKEKIKRKKYIAE